MEDNHAHELSNKQAKDRNNQCHMTSEKGEISKGWECERGLQGGTDFCTNEKTLHL